MLSWFPIFVCGMSVYMPYVCDMPVFMPCLIILHVVSHHQKLGKSGKGVGVVRGHT